MPVRLAISDTQSVALVPATPSADARVLPRVSKVEVKERTPDVQRPRTQRFIGVDRTYVAHRLIVGGEDFSKFVTDISVNEAISKDTEATIVLDNAEFRLSNRKALTTGSIVGVSLFDGQRWREFPVLTVAEPEREYAESGTITLTCRTAQALQMQFREASAKWEEKRDSEVVIDIANLAGLKAEVQETPLIEKETALSKEPVSQFLNRLADRNGYEWYVESGTLFFKKPVGVDRGLTLLYRPESQATGTIISARVRRQTISKSGSSGAADVPAVDFEKGDVDAATVEQAEEGGLFNGLKSSFGFGAPQKPKATNTSDLKNTVTQDAVVGYELNAATGAWVPVKQPHEVQSPEQAKTAEQAAVLSGAVEDANAYEWVLDVETYGMADITVRQIANILGLSIFDDGRWLISELKTKYNAGNAYRLSLTAKSAARAEGGEVGAGATAAAKTVEPTREAQPEVYVLKAPTAKWQRGAVEQ